MELLTPASPAARVRRGSRFGAIAAKVSSNRPPQREEWTPTEPLRWSEVWSSASSAPANLAGVASLAGKGRQLRDVASRAARRRRDQRGAGSIVATHAPPPSSGAVVVALDSTVLCIVGLTSKEQDPEQPLAVWAYTAADSSWHQLRPDGRCPQARVNFGWDVSGSPSAMFSGLTPRSAAESVRGPSRSEREKGVSLLIVGGVAHGGDRAPVLNDGWEFRVDTQNGGSGQWQPLSAKTGPGLPKRHAHACALLRDGLYTFGGLIAAGAGQAPAPGPVAGGAVGDGLKRRAVTSDVDCFPANDLWCLEMGSSKQWREVMPHLAADDDSFCPRPAGRSFHTLTAVGSRLVLFGGRGADGRCLNDLWIWEEEQESAWRRVSYFTGCAPCPRMGHAACAFDDVLYVFGGVDFGYCGDLWEIDIDKTVDDDVRTPGRVRWKLLSEAGQTPAPPARTGSSLCVHFNRPLLVLYGGAKEFYKLGDLWAFSLERYDPTSSVTPLFPGLARAQWKDRRKR
eukprot:TRINITY_DN32608_c0_g1_i1.p1 TRINITY_DN32608_c0_g1~~TRINITY_DN32608_c0_g1_i1.p1  ORF type:complete len:529 (+),score=119.92 TRINITY_DN32608_c0_g1_i1:57-1589(+)